MNKVYLVLLSSEYDRVEVAKHLGTTPNVKYWFYSLPNSIFVQTTLSSKEICKVIWDKFGEKRCFVTRVSPSDYYGILPKDKWDVFYGSADSSIIK